MKKLAIIGASYLQEPLIRRANEMDIETHVFAWAANDVGEKIADHFYPISITEKDEILKKCREIGIDGICSIASDLAVITVNYVADKLGLIGNGPVSTELSTNKHNMRIAFEGNGDSSPHSIMVSSVEDIKDGLVYPVIVKPIDRSGSRGIFKVFRHEELEGAIEGAKAHGFIKNALIEEYAEGREYSIECISYRGEHRLLAITLKYTTGSPHFIETGHIEPADISEELYERITGVIFHALDTLEIKYGASHSEIKIDENDRIKIIEIGARMGGDFIGSTLVFHSTGIDFVRAVIQIALGEKPDLSADESVKGHVGVRFICDEDDVMVFQKVLDEGRCEVLASDIPEDMNGEVTDSSSRFGYYIIKSYNRADVLRYMPADG